MPEASTWPPTDGDVIKVAATVPLGNELLDDMAAGLDPTPTPTPAKPIRWRDLTERAVWTTVAAGVSSPAVVELTNALAGGNLAGWKVAAVSVASAAGTGLVNSLLVIARYKLSALPDPGTGIPAI